MLYHATYRKKSRSRVLLIQSFVGGLTCLLFFALAACAGGTGTTPTVPTNPTAQAAETSVATVVHAAVGTITAAETATASARVTPTPTPAGQQDLGPVVDDTRDTTVTITIGGIVPGGSCAEGCVTPIVLKVRVGTKITWLNNAKFPRTITAMEGDSAETAHKVGVPAPQIFDSGIDQLIYPGQTFSYTVTEAAYAFHANHKVFYFDQIHPSTLGELIIVP